MWLSRPSTSSTATTCCTRAAFDDARELVDRLASFVALHGARGVVVFDGVGEDGRLGPLEVRYAENADALLERLAAEHRASETGRLVSSDSAVRGTSGQEVQKRSSRTFVADLEEHGPRESKPSQLRERARRRDASKLERLRRGAEAKRSG